MELLTKLGIFSRLNKSDNFERGFVSVMFCRDFSNCVKIFWSDISGIFNGLYLNFQLELPAYFWKAAFMSLKFIVTSVYNRLQKTGCKKYFCNILWTFFSVIYKVIITVKIGTDLKILKRHKNGKR
jgi:hypothetical protein